MISKLIKMNFKNDLSHMLTYFLIVLLSALMLHTGIITLIGYSHVHMDKVKKYNFADVGVTSVLSEAETEQVEELIRQSNVVEDYDYVLPIGARAKMGSDWKHFYFVADNEWGRIEAPHFIELSDKKYDNPIYISLNSNINFFKKNVGDSVELEINNEKYTFQIAGIYEAIISSVDNDILYISPDIYDKWEKMRDERRKKALEAKADGQEINMSDLGKAKFFYVKTKEGIRPIDAAGVLTKAFSENHLIAYAYNVETVISELVLMQNIIAAIMIILAGIIMVITMIIIYFRVSNSIEQNITDIGALKALGYTSGQIRRSIVVEFASATLAATLLGIAVSYIILPYYENAMRYFGAIKWEYSFDIIPFLVTTGGIIAVVICVTLLSTKKLFRLEPVIALRFGINSHSFKKNRAPIEKTAGPLVWIMALKAALSNKKQNIMLIVMTLAISFVTTMSVFIWYNVISHQENLHKLLDTLYYDISVDIEGENVMPEIKKRPEVERVIYEDWISATVEGYSVEGCVYADWLEADMLNIYEGRAPKYDNEISIGGVVAELAGVGVGDEVDISSKGHEEKYLITGLHQGNENSGMTIAVTTEGAVRLGNDIKPYTYLIRVKGDKLISTEKVIKYVKETFGDKVTRCYNRAAYVKNDDDITMIATIVVGLLVAVSLVIILLSMSLMIKTIIIRRSRDYGIKKAIGFSSLQLRLELALSMLPQIIAGGLLGSVAGCLTENDIMAAMLKSMGIMKSSMEVYMWMGGLSVLGIAMTSFVIIMLFSRRIRKISAYDLIVE
ncbi:FtsX-like permease family protein [Eubacterium ruminantium]|nr:FtsX-like permease family protein [Eubacterium ruminantium]